MSFDAGARPSGWETAGDHERRIRALEAIDDCCSQVTECSTFDDKIGELSILYPDELVAWWKLGDGASPFLDTSGNPLGPTDLVKSSTGTAMTDSVAGCLTGDQDDGAVQFNNSAGEQGDRLQGSEATGQDFDFVNGPVTFVAWVKPIASGSSFSGYAVSNAIIASFGFSGWGLGITWPGQEPFFIRRDGTETPSDSAILTGSSLLADTCYLLVASYDSTNGHFFYVDGELVDSDTQTFPTSNNNNGPTVGRAGNTLIPFAGFYGTVDEVSIWARVLSETEIREIYQAGSCDNSNAALEGMVLTADGAGGTYWDYPTIEVLEDGV